MDQNRIEKKKWQAVIFDLDGTLLYTLEDIADSVNYILKKYGYVEKTPEEIRRSLGNGARRLMKLAVPLGEENKQFEQILLEYEAYYESHCRRKTRPYPGIPKLLEQLKQENIRTAIVSNKGDGAVKALNEIYFSKYMDTAVGERSGMKKKPAPDTVLEALKELGTDREHAVYVGDSEVDFKTAANAGMTCILVTWGFRDKEQLLHLAPDHLADTPEEIFQILTAMEEAECLQS
ncbi:MAG: HAD family hydrolase [Lachnospiraceae bacterium]|nr:HAD family hydrolase [Lachnospiraceae bacterium]